MHLSPALAIAATSSSLFLLICAAAFLMFLRRCTVSLCCFRARRGRDDAELGRVAHEPAEPGKNAAAAAKAAVLRFGWEEVEALTGGFTAAVIGEGGFSTVYLGKLPEPSTAATATAATATATVAAFKLQHSSERLYRAFLQERDVLLHVKHPNIVQLLGYSDDGEQGVLIFEYVPNGTLHERLHADGDLTPSDALPWSRRMSILFQIASAVDYLHDGCDLQIVHGDLTASNVLLDRRLDAKLCDFGFARMGFSGAVKPAAAGHMVGSPGYADPHYLRTGIISKKSDVYSFGVLILELVTGIPAVGSGDERMLTVVMRERGWDKLGDMVDPRLGTEFDAVELAVIVEIAGRCVGDRPGLRPSMGEIMRDMRERVNV